MSLCCDSLLNGLAQLVSYFGCYPAASSESHTPFPFEDCIASTHSHGITSYKYQGNFYQRCQHINIIRIDSTATSRYAMRVLVASDYSSDETTISRLTLLEFAQRVPDASILINGGYFSLPRGVADSSLDRSVGRHVGLGGL